MNQTRKQGVWVPQLFQVPLIQSLLHGRKEIAGKTHLRGRRALVGTKTPCGARYSHRGQKQVRPRLRSQTSDDLNALASDAVCSRVH